MYGVGVNSKYEGVHTFCFICGIVRYNEILCDKLFNTPVEQLMKPYRMWMRADPQASANDYGGDEESENGGRDENNCQTLGFWKQNGAEIRI